MTDPTLELHKLPPEQVANFIRRANQALTGKVFQGPPPTNGQRWPIEEDLLRQRITSLKVFTDNDLNRVIRQVLLLPDSLSSMSRAVGHIFHIFYPAEHFIDRFMPGKYNGSQEGMNNKKSKAEYYRAFYQIFMHVLGFKDSNKFDDSYLCRQIFAATQNFRSTRSKNAAAHNNCNERNNASNSRSSYIDNDDDVVEVDHDAEQPIGQDHEMAEIGDALEREPLRRVTETDEPFTFSELEAMMVRMEDILAASVDEYTPKAASKPWFNYETESRVYNLKVFDDEYMDDMFHEILVRPDSVANLSNCSENVARIFWTREDVQGKRIRSYKHREKFDNIFMHLLGIQDSKTMKSCPEYYRILQKLTNMKW